MRAKELRQRLASVERGEARPSDIAEIIEASPDFQAFFPGDPFVGEAFGPARIVEAGLQSTIQWAEGNVVFSSRVPTSKPGPFRATTIPAITAKGGPLECLNDDMLEKIVVMKGSQTALTTTAYVWLAHCMATDPASALVVMNSTMDAKHKCAETWKPMFEDSPGLHRYLPQDIRTDWVNKYQLVNQSPVYWTGANSAGALGSKPIRRLILDEVDKYPQAFGRGQKSTKSQAASEAGAVALAEQRVKTYRKSGRAKILEFSTPTDDQGEIAQAYERGDKRMLHVACPHCKAEQVMVWKHVKIDMKLAAKDPTRATGEAQYQCPHCKRGWTEHERIAAIAAGEWRPTTRAKVPKLVSFWIPSWLSPFVTMEYLAAKWIAAQGNKTMIQDFVNSECGEPFVHFENLLKPSLFRDLEGEYEQGRRFTQAPIYAAQYDGMETAVFGGVDVQKGYLVATFREWVRGGDSGMVWHGTVSDMAALDRLAEQYGAQFVLIDSRYRTREVQEFCVGRAGYIPCEGVKTRAKSLYSVNTLDLDEGRSSRTGVRVIETLAHDGDQLKDILTDLIQGVSDRRWMIPAGFSAERDYTAQMTAERCVNGRWVNPLSKANHAWDSEVLCLLAAIRFGYCPVGKEAK